MTDNVAITPGSGATIAADDIGGGVLVQRVKATWGADGVANDVSAADPLPVTLDAQMITAVPDSHASALPVRPVGQHTWACSFSDVGASVLSDDFLLLRAGTGVSYSQNVGSLAIAAGTTAGAEFLARSTEAWRGSMRLRASMVASQRIANTNFAFVLADNLGDALSYTIVNSTTITVTLPAHGFHSENQGQYLFVGGITGAAGIPGRFAISSIVNANNIQITVAGWPASGSGTLCLFGRSHVKLLFTGTTATQMAVDVQRNGWAVGDTTATINTTANPGTIVQADLTGREVFFADKLRVSSTTPAVAVRASRDENVPDDNLDLYLYLWSFNGSSAPASSTAWNVSFASVEQFPSTPVFIQGARAQGAANPLPVYIASSVNLGIGLLPALAAGTNLIGDVGHQYRANATGAATIAPVYAPATPTKTTVKASAGRLLGWTLTNNTAAVKSVKIWNLLIASITLGTTAALFEIDIPPNESLDFKLEGGAAFSVGIAYAVTGAIGLSDNTGITAGDVTGAFFYA